MMKRLLLAAALCAAALLAPHDGVAEAPDGQTVYLGERYFTTVHAKIGADGKLEIGCGAVDPN